VLIDWDISSTALNLILSSGNKMSALQWRTQEFFSEEVFARNFFRGGSTNSVDNRGQRERRSGGCSPLVRGSTQFVNE
jgi:hypothetical protein